MAPVSEWLSEEGRTRATYSCYSDDSRPLTTRPESGSAPRPHPCSRRAPRRCRLVVGSAAGAAGQPQEAPAPSRVPPNLSAQEALRQLVGAVVEESATFRHRCARIAATPASSSSCARRLPGGSPLAAVTTIRRHEDGAITALVELHQRVDVVEHIAPSRAHDRADRGREPAPAVGEEGTGRLREQCQYLRDRRAVEAGRRVARDSRAALARASRCRHVSGGSRRGSPSRRRCRAGAGRAGGPRRRGHGERNGAVKRRRRAPRIRSRCSWRTAPAPGALPARAPARRSPARPSGAAFPRDGSISRCQPGQWAEPFLRPGDMAVRRPGRPSDRR